MTLQRVPQFDINYDNDYPIIDYMEMLGTNENANIPFERRIEELTEQIRRLREELYRVTYVNINYTIQPNGNG